MQWIGRVGVVGMGLMLASWAMAAGPVEYVISISVDGMGSSYMQKGIDEGKLPNLKRIQAEGANTDNARADVDITITLPNHTTMVTSRGILGVNGHNWTINEDPKPGVTLHSNKGSYVASVFDVAHDAGLRTGMWATKSKFSLFMTSYDEVHGAPSSRGNRKLDVFVDNESSEKVTSNFVQTMSTQPCNYAFVHYRNPDTFGHAYGWGSEEYVSGLMTADKCIGQILNLVSTDPKLKDHTVVMVTADHGGVDKNHADASRPIDYTIPFLVWGAGVEHGDLYAMNPDTRKDPGTSRVPYGVGLQPVHNGDVGNLSLSLLGLGPIPGSTINYSQDLKVSTAPAAKKAADAKVRLHEAA